MPHENTMAGQGPRHERDDGLPPVWPWDRQQDNPDRHRAFDSDDSSSTPSHAADIDASRPSKQAKMSWEAGKEHTDQEFSRKMLHGDEYESDDSSSTPSHAADIDASRPSKQAKQERVDRWKDLAKKAFERAAYPRTNDAYESGSTEDEEEFESEEESWKTGPTHGYLTEPVVSSEGEKQFEARSGYVSEYDIALGDLDEERNPSDLFGELPWWDHPDAQVREHFRDAIEQAEDLSRNSFTPFGGPLSQAQREEAARFFREAPHLEANVCTCGVSSCDGSDGETEALLRDMVTDAVHDEETARILDREAHSGPATRRDEVLTEASDLIHGDRNGAYDHPGENFRRIAVFWSEILKAKLGAEVVTEADVANMMVAVKLARNLHSNRKDNWVDMAGYAACGHEVSDYDTE